MLAVMFIVCLVETVKYVKYRFDAALPILLQTQLSQLFEQIFSMSFENFYYV